MEKDDDDDVERPRSGRTTRCRPICGVGAAAATLGQAVRNRLHSLSRGGSHPNVAEVAEAASLAEAAADSSSVEAQAAYPSLDGVAEVALAPPWRCHFCGCPTTLPRRRLLLRLLGLPLRRRL